LEHFHSLPFKAVSYDFFLAIHSRAAVDSYRGDRFVPGVFDTTLQDALATTGAWAEDTSDR
jgi:hypothetical protein